MTPARAARLRRVGWLLTPLVVWAASFLGAWFGALLARSGIGPYGGVTLMAAGAVAAGVIAVVAWLRLVRHLTSGTATADAEADQ